jgi:hypothetical protein
MEDTKIKRRSFLKMAGAAIAGMALPFKSGQADAAVSATTVSGGRFWVNPGTAQEYFRQKVVNARFVNSDNMIWAKVDGWWQKYELAGYSEEFFNWFVEDTFKWYDVIFNEGKSPPNGGHHTPGISTYGNRRGRGDSSFHLNSAFKSVTIAPKVENLDYYLGVYEQALAGDLSTYSLDWKKSLLRNPDFWDRRLLISTDLYSNQNAKTVDLSTGETDVEQTSGYKESHYLLNTMVNPVANFLYLDSFTSNAAPTWELRGIVANTHWNNPDQDEATLLYQKYRKCVLYPHQLQHGRTANHIGIVFHIAELFDNKDSETPPGRGVRVVPPGFQYVSHAEYNLKRMVGKV